MLLSTPELTIYSYTVNNEKIELIGEITDASSVSYAKRFVGYGRLEMYVPLTDKNVQLCKVGNMLSMGSSGRYCYMIMGIEPQKDSDGFVK